MAAKTSAQPLLDEAGAKESYATMAAPAIVIPDDSSRPLARDVRRLRADEDAPPTPRTPRTPKVPLWPETTRGKVARVLLWIIYAAVVALACVIIWCALRLRLAAFHPAVPAGRVATCCCLLPHLACRKLVTAHAENHVVAWAVAGIFVGIAVPLSMHDIFMHVTHYVCPPLQR